MSRQHHYVKILPKYFMDVDSGIKTFEIRFNDRGYKVGDILHLQEFCGGEYTGRVIEKEICYMIDSPEYCKEGFVVLGLKGEINYGRNVVRDAPTADVVPRTEVDLYRKQVELASTYDKLEKLEHILDCYALQYGTVTDQQKVIDKAKAEVAREIFEEIEKHRDKIHGIALLLPEELAELKKKYTEDKDEQAPTRDPI